MSDEGRTESGEPKPGGSEWRPALEDHLQRHLGEAIVNHPLLSLGMHIDVFVFEPTPDRPYITAVTVGVSEFPMVVPDNEPERRHQELMVYLPAGWPLDPNAGSAAVWPFWLLRALGRFAHDESTYFAPGHTVALANPPEPFVPGVPFTTALLLDPPEPSSFDELTIGDTPCRFLWAIPLTTAEADYKLSNGGNALLEKLREADVRREIDPARACLITGS